MVDFLLLILLDINSFMARNWFGALVFFGLSSWLWPKRAARTGKDTGRLVCLAGLAL